MSSEIITDTANPGPQGRRPCLPSLKTQTPRQVPLIGEVQGLGLELEEAGPSITQWGAC